MDLPPDLQATLDAILRRSRHLSHAQLQHQLDAAVNAYNAAPQDELCGLSPYAASQLLQGDWETTGAMRIAADLTDAELRDVPILADARTVLRFMLDEGPVKETTAKYLPMATIAALLPALRMLPVPMDDYPGARPPTREMDLQWLPSLRLVLHLGGLLTRRAGVRTSARGRALIAPDRAGELFATLFRTFFIRMDLRTFGGSDDHPALQSTVALSFYKLRTDARDWSSDESLARSAWLPSAKDPIRSLLGEGDDYRHYTFGHRVLEPLVQFGLLEARRVRGDDPIFDAREYRCTPLFERALRFVFVE